MLRFQLSREALGVTVRSTQTRQSLYGPRGRARPHTPDEVLRLEKPSASFGLYPVQQLLSLPLDLNEFHRHGSKTVLSHQARGSSCIPCNVSLLPFHHYGP